MSQPEYANGLRGSNHQTNSSTQELLEEYSKTLTQLEGISYEKTKDYTIEELKEYAVELKEIYYQYAKIAKEFKQSLIKEKANEEVLKLLKEFKENKHDTSRVLNGVNKQLIKLGDQPIDKIAVSSITSQFYTPHSHQQQQINMAQPPMSQPPPGFSQGHRMSVAGPLSAPCQDAAAYDNVKEVSEEKPKDNEMTEVMSAMIFKINEISHEHVSPEKIQVKPEHTVSREDELFKADLDNRSQCLSKEDRTSMHLMEGVPVTAEGSVEEPSPVKDKKLPENRTNSLQRKKNKPKRMSKNVAQVFQKFINKTQVFISKKMIKVAKALEERASDYFIAREIKPRRMFWTNSLWSKQRRKGSRLPKSCWRVSWKPPPVTLLKKKVLRLRALNYP